MAKVTEQTENKPKNKGGNPAWVKGVSGNPGGRPKKGFAIADMIRAKVTDEDWDDILQATVEQAKKGDKAARDYLSNRRDGMPRQTQINIDQNIEKIEGIEIE